ncbi:hypothetical protein, partial [Moorena sp. SIO2C4]
KLRVPPFPLKKGDFEYGSPLNKGGWGGSNILRKTLKTHPRGAKPYPESATPKLPQVGWPQAPDS